MKIGGFNFENSLFLAPMAGVTDFAFRSLAREFGADLSFSEMISAKGLVYNSEKTKNMLFCLKNENPSAVQFFGNDPQVFEKAIKMPEVEKFDIVDINFGCPAPKIFNNGEGSALLNDYKKMQEIVIASKKATTKPVGAKIRLGIDKIDFDVCKALQEAGVDYITVHGRTKVQGYSGKANYDAIAKIKSLVSVPVIGNGDVEDKESFDKMKQTGVDGVMIGRGSLGRPWVFAEILEKDISISPYDVIEKHISLLREKFNDDFLCKYLRKHLLWYLKGYSANELKIKVCKLQDLDEILKEFKNFFDKANY